MAKTRVGINGFGRIGRNFLRAHVARGGDFDIVAVNDIGDTKTMAHLLKYDSVLGPFSGHVESADDSITVDGSRIAKLTFRDPAELPWGDLGVDIAVESTGLFTKRAQAEAHLTAGAKKVVISAPATDPDVTLVLGVNDDDYDPAEHNILSNASCTTNCVAPMAKVLHDAFTIEQGFMTTVHAYTNDQRVLDLPHEDMRRARAAAINLIPTSTGAAKAIGLVLPDLAGKVDGMSIRAPVPDGSVVDFVVRVGRETTVDEVNGIFEELADTGPLEGILRYTDEPIVSSDVIGSSYSCVFDSGLTMVVGNDGQGLRLVRQRVGLQLPPRGSRRADGAEARTGTGRSEGVNLPRSVREADVAGKHVLVRADLNVPLEDGEVADDLRIRSSVPTLEWLVDHGAQEVVVAPTSAVRTASTPTIRSHRARIACATLLPDERIRVLENTRFDERETANDPAFAAELADRDGPLRERRVRRGASRACVDRGRGPHPARVRRAADGGRVRPPRPAAGRRRAAVRARRRRREGRRQARRAAERRRHGPTR